MGCHLLFFDLTCTGVPLFFCVGRTNADMKEPLPKIIQFQVNWTTVRNASMVAGF